jgi:hypothetical protein
MASKIMVTQEATSAAQAAAAGNSRDVDDDCGCQLAFYVEAVHGFTELHGAYSSHLSAAAVQGLL